MKFAATITLAVSALWATGAAAQSAPPPPTASATPAASALPLTLAPPHVAPTPILTPKASAPPAMSQAYAPVVHAPPPFVIPPHLAGSSVYIYSFLDAREMEFTRLVLDQINGDLKERLSAASVKTDELEFLKSPTGGGFSAGMSVGQSSTTLPLRQVIVDTAAEEAQFGAQYRLIVVPAYFGIAGAWRFYTIRWSLVDSHTGRVVWDYSYTGKHMVMWKNSENAKARSQKILDALFAELHAKSVL